MCLNLSFSCTCIVITYRKYYKTTFENTMERLFDEDEERPSTTKEETSNVVFKQFYAHCCCYNCTLEHFTTTCRRNICEVFVHFINQVRGYNIGFLTSLKYSIAFKTHKEIVISLFTKKIIIPTAGQRSPVVKLVDFVSPCLDVF